jgi:hypothetical protein
MSEYINNRELATIVWLSIALIFILTLPKIRKSIQSILSYACTLKLNIIYTLTALYIILMGAFLSKFYLWDIGQIKVTIIWLLASAVPNICKIHSFKNKKESFKDLIFSGFKVVVILNTLINSYVFEIFIELLLTPFLTIIAILIAYCEVNPEKKDCKQACQFISVVINIITLLLVSNALYGLFLDPNTAVSKQKIIEFFLPIVLTILFIPLLYLLLVYSIYETVFMRIDRLIADNILNKKIKFRVILLFNFRTKLLERWQRHALCKNVNSYSEILSSIKKILQISKSEKRKQGVPISEGWAPHLAKEFLANKGLLAGDYDPPQDPDDKIWFACSSMLEIDEELPSNNISYYIEGYEGSVKSLKLSMNINNKKKASAALDKFIGIASFLYRSAVNHELSHDIRRVFLHKESEFKKDLNLVAINIKSYDWGNGYTVNFTILNIKARKSGHFSQ